jgi:hypothetical protein
MESMKLRHTAALALVGWCFVYPPRADRLDAPFSEWHRGNSEPIKSKRECEDNWRAPILKRTEGITDPVRRAKVLKAYGRSLCVEDTDPRFKALRPPPWRFDSKGNFIVEPNWSNWKWN